MYRVAAYLGLPEDKLHIDVSYTMLVVNVSDGAHSYSKFQKLIADFDFASLEAIDRRIDWSTVRIINL